VTVHRLEIFADYFQFYLQDECSSGDLSAAWDQQSVDRKLAVSSGVVGIRTVRNVTVPVELEILESEPLPGRDGFDHVVQGTLVLQSSRLIVAGWADDLADAPRFDVAPDIYRVMLSASGLTTLSPDGLEGEDRYLVQLWPASPIDPFVLKQHA